MVQGLRTGLWNPRASQTDTFTRTLLLLGADSRKIIWYAILLYICCQDGKQELPIEETFRTRDGREAGKPFLKFTYKEL